MEKACMLQLKRESLKKLELKFCGYSECESLHSFGPASRPTYILHIVLEGKGIFVVDNKKYFLEKGQGFIIEPNIVTFYQADAKNPWKYFWIGFDGEGAEKYLRELGIIQHKPIFRTDKLDELFSLLKEMLKRKNLTLAEELKLQGLFYEFFSLIVEENSIEEKDEKNELNPYVDKIITFSEDKEIFNIPCISIENGIDLEEVKLVEKKEHKGINFISVSQCHFWHGIDRVLYSLLQYIKSGGKEEIRFHIVGEGTETPKLKKIVENNIELQDMVTFYGFKSGEELDEIYNNSDIALGSLGFYRSGLEKGSTLKMREYCAKGLPFVVGYDDTSFSKDLSFYYQVSNDESLLDIEKIIEWYKNLKVTPEEIRKYAEDNLSWDKQMKKVIDNI